MIGAFVQLNSDSRYAQAKPVGYIICESGCWEWVGSLATSGHAQIWRGGKHVLAHRFVYEMERGSIPDGLPLDHLCRNRKCVNPWHLEAVSLHTNILRGVSPPAHNSRKTHCPNGHALIEGNVVKSQQSRGWRQCSICKKESDSAYRKRNRDRYRAQHTERARLYRKDPVKRAKMVASTKAWRARKREEANAQA